jgi:hypothetical protein
MERNRQVFLRGARRKQRTLLDGRALVAKESLIVGLATPQKDQLALLELLLPRAEQRANFLRTPKMGHQQPVLRGLTTPSKTHIGKSRFVVSTDLSTCRFGLAVRGIVSSLRSTLLPSS